MSLRWPSKRSASAVLPLMMIALMTWSVQATDAEPQSRMYYVSLGDSLARGWQPAPNGRTRETLKGYVDDVAATLTRSHPGLNIVKYGCPGETAASMMDGGHCHYSHGSELAQAENFLRVHRGHIVAVTVNIGDNDVEQCLINSRIDSACVNREFGVIRTRLPRIASGLRTAAGVGVNVAGLTDYDQFLAYWLEGTAGQSLARRTVKIVGRLNQTADGIYSQAGLRVADAGAAFASTDFTHYATLPGHGRVPRSVQRVCTWTWACSKPPIGFNDHANATGYRVLANVLLAALK